MRRLAALAAVLALAGCLHEQKAALPAGPVPHGGAIAVEAQAVPLDPADPARTAIGRFTYAGGVWLTSSQTSRLHGLSDLKITPDGRLLAIGDQSDLFEARVKLDATGRLTGVTDGRISALKDEAGTGDMYARGPREFDTEGIAELAGGVRVVAFEQDDRVLAYPAAGGAPRPAPMPAVKMTFNKGMEAMVAAPEVAPDAYRVGLEDSGLLFLCRLSTTCQPDGRVDLEGSELSAMERLPGGGRAYLFRTYSPMTGNVIRLRITDAAGRTLDAMTLARPLTVDNMEGLAAVPLKNAGIRFYMISDDNFGTYAGLPTDQRTLLLAFDWRP